MLRVLLPLAGLLLASSASAATLTWDAGEGTDACLSPRSVERQVEARLGRALSQLAPAQRVQVRIEPSAKRWVVRIEMQGANGALLGRRVLTLTDDPCRQVEGFVALALALMIDPEAALLPPPAAEDTAPSTPPPAPAGETTHEGDVTPPAVVAEPALASVSGSGKTVVYLFPAVLPLDLEHAWPREVPTDDSARLAQRLLAQRLWQREVYTLVELPTFFDSQRDAARFVRDSTERPPKPPLTPSGPARPPDYTLIPHIEELSVQDGHDYSLGTRSRVTVVSVRLRVFGVDFGRRRELKSFLVKTGFSIEGSRHDAKLRRFALQLAFEKAADEILDALRPEPAFRIRPRLAGDHLELPSLRGVSNGDRFVFEAADGSRSGYASVYDVEGDRAHFNVWQSGRGERLLHLSRARRTVLSISLRGVQRLAYSEPSASEATAASEQGLRARHFGTGTEFGLDWRLWREPASGSGLRPLLNVGWTFMFVDNLALNISAKAGLGYELPLIPGLGIGVMPYLNLGLLGVRGTLGDRDASQSSAKLDALLAAAGTFGAQFEFYRLLGNFSLLAGAELEYVVPLLSLTPRDEFVDARYPSLHGLGLQLGVVWRPADYPN
ncbi:MAG: hypothetical protein QM756_03750 [Polyangiaceae bacterium]